MSKDIWIIDDNSKDQRKAYGASFVEEEAYDDILSHVECLNADSDLSFIEGAKCVCIHDSLEDYIDGYFLSESHIAKEHIIDYLEKNSIRYVCFSDGHSIPGVYDGYEFNLVQIKKSAFYERLAYFLNHYKDHSELQFHILAYGKNYVKELLAVNIKALFAKFSAKSPTEVLTLRDVMPDKREEPEYLKKIVELSAPSLGISYNDLLDFIEDEEITIKEFTSKINQILISASRYGKNTYTWK
ncbi:MAG: hypothetical protein K2M31_05970 [Muribaculaceae bacterium]|nr:hypothetical protein [Muribaculaceae bacterium]